MKRLVIYYSLTGCTKEAAEYIAEKTSSDIFMIDTIEPMPEEQKKIFLYGGMRATFGLCPEIKKLPENIAEYDEIILGTPIWAGKNAPAFNTLMKKEKALCDKVSYVFTFSGGGDNARCMKKLNRRLPNIKYNVALQDKNYAKDNTNNEKIEDLISKILVEY